MIIDWPVIAHMTFQPSVSERELLLGEPALDIDTEFERSFLSWSSQVTLPTHNGTDGPSVLIRSK